MTPMMMRFLAVAIALAAFGMQMKVGAEDGVAPVAVRSLHAR